MIKHTLAPLESVHIYAVTVQDIDGDNVNELKTQWAGNNVKVETVHYNSPAIVSSKKHYCFILIRQILMSLSLPTVFLRTSRIMQKLPI